jgi:hypothetical protein
MASPERALSVFRSGARARVAQSRHGGRSGERPLSDYPDWHSTERPPPLRLAPQETVERRRRDREMKKGGDEETGDHDPGAIASRERRSASF